jgi:hypothetical protein
MVGKVMRDSWRDRLSFPFKDTATLLKALSVSPSPSPDTTKKPRKNNTGKEKEEEKQVLAFLHQ